MLSDGKTRAGEAADVSGAARQTAETRNPKDSSSLAARPATSNTNNTSNANKTNNKATASPAVSDETLAKEALEGLKRIRAKARLDKMALPKPPTAVMQPAVIVAKPPPPRPPWVAPLASLAVAVALVVSACTGVM